MNPLSIHRIHVYYFDHFYLYKNICGKHGIFNKFRELNIEPVFIWGRLMELLNTQSTCPKYTIF